MLESQQKNPAGAGAGAGAGVSQSLQKRVAPNGKHDKPESPFSIRQYVLDCRKKDVFSNWPFPEKYLQICLDHGISDALPPFESHTSAIQSIKGAVDLNCTQQDDNNAVDFESEVPDIIEQETEGESKLYSDTEEAISKLSNQHCHFSLSNGSRECEENKADFSSHISSNSIVSTDQPLTTIPISHLNVIECNETLTSSRKPRHMKKRHKGKHKKRSMGNILDVAKPCTPEDLLRIKRLCCVSSVPLEQGGEGIENLIDAKQDCNSDLTKDYSSEKLEKDGSEAANLSMQSGKKFVVKFTFSGCKSNG